MPIIADIADWAGQQPDWASDAIRRLIHQGELTTDDIDDLAAMVKARCGLPDPKDRIAAPLDRNTVPEEAVSAPAVSLVAIREPKHVNAIAVKDGITFEPVGLTTVYGNNGAGKSGYARVLKKACRARKAEDIHPNVYDTEDKPGRAQARFEWMLGDAPDGVDWMDGTPSPAALSRIAVFDSHCARVFIDDQAIVSYVPFGFDILRDYAAALQLIQKQIDVEAGHKKFDMRRLDALQGETDVGRLVAGLKHTSVVTPFLTLALLSAEEIEEKVVLTKQLGDADPARAAVAMRRFAGGLRILEDELASLEEPLSDENVEALESAFKKLAAAEKASKLAAAILQEDGHALPGTGTEPWEILVRSAMTFATEQVHPGRDFPGPPDDPKCVLCQQSLSSEAKERLEHFVTFIETDAQRQFNEQRRQAGALYKAMAGVDFNSFPSNEMVMEELEELNSGLALSIGQFVEALIERKKAIIEMAPNRSISGLANLPDSPTTDLLQLRNFKLGRAARLEAALTPEDRKGKAKRLVELEAREKLHEQMVTVVEAIGALKVEYAYSEASRACATTAVTRKMNELYDQTVTAELQDALVNECAALGVKAEIFGLDMSGQRGMRMQKLKLSAAPQFSRIKPSAVLSEGEQRAVALAAFLAEVGIEQDGSGIVFDDPVSSLDQMRKERIATRLVREAKHRQVIVFTHDLAFAWTLRDQASSTGVAHAERYVFQAERSKGHIQPGFPFEAKKLDARVNDLKSQAARARKALEVEKDFDAYNALVRQAYRRMRDTWELVIEDLLFNAAVKRFRRSIETQRLDAVLVDDQDIREVWAGMTRCSCFTHEGSVEAPPTLPAPDEFEADLDALATTVSRLKARLSEVGKRRKKEGLLA